jgi:hypothetical protein
MDLHRLSSNAIFTVSDSFPANRYPSKSSPSMDGCSKEEHWTHTSRASDANCSCPLHTPCPSIRHGRFRSRLCSCTLSSGRTPAHTWALWRMVRIHFFRTCCRPRCAHAVHRAAHWRILLHSPLRLDGQPEEACVAVDCGCDRPLRWRLAQHHWQRDEHAVGVHRLSELLWRPCCVHHGGRIYLAYQHRRHGSRGRKLYRRFYHGAQQSTSVVGHR